MRFPAFVLSVPVLLFGIVFTAPHDRVYAATTTSSPGMWGAISGVVAATAAANGFVPADPRIAETVKAIGAAAAAVGGSIATATGEAIASVPWVAVGAAAGIGAVLAGVPTSLGDDSMGAWQFNPDGTVTVNPPGSSSGSSGSGSSPFPTLQQGQPYWVDGTSVGSSPEAAAQAAVQVVNAQASFQQYGWTEELGGCTQGSTSTEYQCSYTVYGSDGSGHGSGYQYASLGSGNWTGSTCSSGLDINNACAAYVPPPSASQPQPVTESVAQAVAGVPADDLSEPLDPALLAALVGALWSQAAEDDNGYAGLPFPVNAPPTAGQAQDVETALGSGAPTVGSAVSGAGSLAGASSTDPFSGTGSGTGTGTGTSTGTGTGTGTATATDPGSGAQVNLGPDPGIGAPSLEAIPTASQILAPVLGLMSDLRAWAVPAHTSQCPEPTFDLWGNTYTISAQCDLLDEYGTQITVAFDVAFAVAAVLIVLTA
jgi:hypothetical protein